MAATEAPRLAAITIKTETFIPRVVVAVKKAERKFLFTVNIYIVFLKVC